MRILILSKVEELFSKSYKLSFIIVLLILFLNNLSPETLSRDETLVQTYTQPFVNHQN